MDKTLQQSGCVFVIAIMCFIFPLFAIIGLPMMIYLSIKMIKGFNEKSKVNRMLEEQTQYLSQDELEEMRVTFLMKVLDPFTNEIERANAKYIVEFIEKKQARINYL